LASPLGWRIYFSETRGGVWEFFLSPLMYRNRFVVEGFREFMERRGLA
jgi:hypothetical protein